MKRWAVFIAEGFGIGRVPVAPGTFGSLLGGGWFALLLSSGSLVLYTVGTVLGLAAAVWLCGIAEKEIGKTDPGSVVLDEMAVMPVCFAGWLWVAATPESRLPDLSTFYAPRQCGLVIVVFLTFRVFDILKPWPIRRSQNLAGGWGIVMDDLIAALFTAGLTGWIARHWATALGTTG